VRALGHPRVHLRRTDSTNDRARSLALAGAPHGTLVTAEEQTAGRGRQGRSWSAPAGSSVLMSLLLREPPRLLPMIGAVAVCDVAGEEAQIKWPNDIVIVQAPGSDARGLPAQPVLAKLAGILAEARPQEGWAVLGIGLNVAVSLEELPAELRADAQTGQTPARTAATLGRPATEVEPTLGRLLLALEARLLQSPDSLLAAWRSRDALRGRQIAWGAANGAADGRSHSAGRGVADGIDGAGRLVVELADGGRTTLDAGEVHLAPLD
jgi:BirA family transcriptional regulator, biotin operon repressor / biotin---[acetyl-CoA-carboxylase] ligase